MFYSIAADIVVVLHFLWIIFLISGAFPGRRHRWIKRIHIAGLSFAVIIQVLGWYCPFTYLEIWLRRMHDPDKSYSGSFIIHYVEKIVYPEVNPEVIHVMTVLLVALSIIIYATGRRK